MSFIIKSSNLTKIFPERVAVKDLSLNVKKGELLGLLGPNGAGKTTTIRMLSGIISPTSGSAQVAGYDIENEVEDLHEVIGLLTETPGFYESLSAWRNLEFFANFYAHLDVEYQIEKYLKIMGLWERRDEKVSGFSKGMKQKLALARSLIHEPEILFFDEPTAGLDPQASREVRDLLMKLKKEGRTIFLCTHNLEEAEILADRIALIDTNLVALDTSSNLKSQIFNKTVIVDLEKVNNPILDTVKKLKFVERVKQIDNQLQIELIDFDRYVPDLIKALVESDARIKGVSETKHSMEDIYLALIKSNEGERL